MSASTSELKLKPCRSPYCECEPGKCTRPGFRDARHEAVESADEEDRLRALFEATAKDSFNFRRSRRGTYVNPAIARDWKWFYLGATKGNNTQRPAAQEVATVTLSSAIEAIEHVSAHNGPGREDEAIAMLRLVNDPAMRDRLSRTAIPAAHQAAKEPR